MATNFGVKLPTHLHWSHWHSKTNCKIAILNASDLCVLILEYKFGDIRFNNLEITRVEIISFGTIGKNWFSAKYLRRYGTDIHQIFTVGRSMRADGKFDIRFAYVQGTLLW